MQKIIIIILIICLSNSCSAQTKQENIEVGTHVDENNFSKQIGYVNDYASILDSLEIKDF